MEPTEDPAATPGWKTTEFWKSFAVQVVSFLILFGVLSPSDADGLAQAITKGVEAIGLIALQLASIVAYIRSRTEAKRAASMTVRTKVEYFPPPPGDSAGATSGLT